MWGLDWLEAAFTGVTTVVHRYLREFTAAQVQPEKLEHIILDAVEHVRSIIQSPGYAATAKHLRILLHMDSAWVCDCYMSGS